MRKALIMILFSGLLQYAPVSAQNRETLRLVHIISLPGVVGRIDHMTADIEGQRLFIAALGNNSVEIVDLRSGKRVHSIRGLHEPQDVSHVPELGRIFVSNGADGSLSLFDSQSLRLIGISRFSDDADNLRYDARSKYLYVGYGRGALGIVDAKSGNIVGDIKLAGHPEAFQLEETGPRIFVNIPSARQVAVVDRDKRSVIAFWPLDAADNFPMALDEKRHRLFIGCRRPAKILIYDTESGKKISSADIAGDVDDIFYDDAHKQIYASCGEGFINVIRQIDADHYEVMTKVKTLRGARTSHVEAERMLLYLAVPGVSGKSAEVRIYTFMTRNDM